MARDTRERIMDVALELFAEQGVSATPVTTIEAAAGLSPGSGSFYRHFKDRADLVAAVVEREMSRVTKDESTQIALVIESGGKPTVETLAEQMRSDLDFLHRLRPMMAILRWEHGRAPALAKRVQAAMSDEGVRLGVADLEAIDALPITQDDPDAAAAVVLSAIVGYYLGLEYFGEGPGHVDATRFTRMLAALVTGELPATDG